MLRTIDVNASRQNFLLLALVQVRMFLSFISNKWVAIGSFLLQFHTCIKYTLINRVFLDFKGNNVFFFYHSLLENLFVFKGMWYTYVFFMSYINLFFYNVYFEIFYYSKVLLFKELLYFYFIVIFIKFEVILFCMNFSLFIIFIFVTELYWQWSKK